MRCFCSKALFSLQKLSKIRTRKAAVGAKRKVSVQSSVHENETLICRAEETQITMECGESEGIRTGHANDATV